MRGRPKGERATKKKETMKLIKTFVVLAALSLMGFGAANLRAVSYPDVANIAWTLSVQGPPTTNHNVITWKTMKVKATTKDLLNLIAENYGHADGYFNGDVLVMWDLYSFSVYSADPHKGGIDLLDVSTSLLSATYHNYIYNESYNQVSLAESYTSTYITYLSFDDSSFNNDGTLFTFYGSTSYRYNIGSTGKWTESLTAQGTAEGYIFGGGLFGDNFVATGKFTASGHY